MQMGQTPVLNDPSPQNQLQSVYGPPRMFLPTREFIQSLQDPPVAGQPLKLPWLGVAQMTGLKKEVADYFNLAGQPAVQIGDVIKGTPADQAGLKPGNIIVKMNGQPLERGDEPDEAAMILMKNVKRMKVGSKLTLSVITDKDKPPTDLTVTLAERPKQENQAKRFYAEDLGFTAREIVFEDTYRRKLPADQKGVIVALVKPAGAAMTGKLERGDLITKLNQTQVTDVDQFKKEYQAFRKAKPREAVVLEAIRSGNDEIIRIEPPQ
jgi:serine protease Do